VISFAFEAGPILYTKRVCGRESHPPRRSMGTKACSTIIAARRRRPVVTESVTNYQIKNLSANAERGFHVQCVLLSSPSDTANV